MDTAIGVRFREERVRLDLTQIQFGKIGGAGRQSIIRFESGERAPDAEFLRRVAKAGADILYIVTGRRTALDDDAIRSVIAALQALLKR
jgi:transcriptional regulator with XRE-family HTH domain